MKPFTPRISTLVVMARPSIFEWLWLTARERQCLQAEARTKRFRVGYRAVQLDLEQPQGPVGTQRPQFPVDPAQLRACGARALGGEGAQHPQRQAARLRIGPGIGRRYGADQIVHGGDPQAPVYRAVGAGASPQIAGLGGIPGVPYRPPLPARRPRAMHG